VHRTVPFEHRVRERGDAVGIAHVGPDAVDAELCAVASSALCSMSAITTRIPSRRSGPPSPCRCPTLRR
jgi:hypothetical protein